MKVQDVKIGKAVKYHPIIGDKDYKDAVITSEVYEICGTLCCKINNRTGVVAIEALEEYD